MNTYYASCILEGNSFNAVTFLVVVDMIYSDDSSINGKIELTLTTKHKCESKDTSFIFDCVRNGINVFSRTLNIGPCSYAKLEITELKAVHLIEIDLASSGEVTP